MQKSFWWWQCSDRYIIALSPYLHTPPPFSPSLISLMVFVDVKHHVYLLTYLLWLVKEATGKKKGGFVCIFVDDRWCSDVTERTALLHRCWTRDCHPAVWEFRQISVTNVGKPQALVYDILPSTTAVFSYVIGSRKLSANEQFFVGAQTVLSLLQTTQIGVEVLLNVLRCQLTY